MRFTCAKELKDTNAWNFREDIALDTISRRIGLIYKRVGKDKYRVYCGNCNEYYDYSFKQFKEVRYSKTCPVCRCQMYECKKDNGQPRKVWMFITFNHKDGYECDVEFNFNKSPKVKISQVARWNNNHLEVKDIYISGFSYYYQQLRPTWLLDDVYDWARVWRKVKLNYMDWFCEWEGYHYPTTKKENLEKYKRLGLKSNQVKLILDHPFNDLQVYAIRRFDLKEADDVYKHNKYYKANNYHIDDTKHIYNSYVLDYLDKNNIRLGQYDDYASMCQKLGRKLDKPKDFKHWHDEVSKMLEIKNDKDCSKNVKARYKELSKNIYEYKDITIKPFKSVSEIQRVAQKLHNCLKNYVREYADGETDIYHLDVKGKPTLAIELDVNTHQVSQCYADNNDDPPRNLELMVERWAKRIYAN